MPEKEVSAEPLEDLIEIVLNDAEQDKKVMIGSELLKKNREEIIKCLKRNKDVFAWTHDEMVGIDPEVMCYSLYVDPKYPPRCQKRHPLNSKRTKALKEEVDMLIKTASYMKQSIPGF